MALKIPRPGILSVMAILRQLIEETGKTDDELERVFDLRKDDHPRRWRLAGK
jgi:hypothetical protein